LNREEWRIILRKARAQKGLSCQWWWWRWLYVLRNKIWGYIDKNIDSTVSQQWTTGILSAGQEIFPFSVASRPAWELPKLLLTGNWELCPHE
jgi:hypothetical protein